jgi:hypothetical protein
MKIVVAVTCCFLCALSVTAQTAAPTSKGRHPMTSSSAKSSGLSAALPAPTTDTDDQEKIRELTHRIQKLELQTVQQPGKQQGDTTAVAVTTAIIAAAAVLGAALLGMFGQHVAAQREDRRTVAAAQHAAELAKQEAVYRNTEKIVEFRLKQMEQFYAPMFALLGQSKGLYDKMLYQLAQDEPERYRWNPQPGAGADPFQVLHHDTWKGFRLLDQLPAVRHNPKAFALAEGVLRIGDQMTEIISKHAGLASENIIDLLGEYLAHYATLSTIYRLGETEPYEPGWHKVRYYPRELNARIEAGYREVSQFIDEYAKASMQMLQALPAANNTQRS